MNQTAIPCTLMHAAQRAGEAGSLTGKVAIVGSPTYPYTLLMPGNARDGHTDRAGVREPALSR